MANLRTRLQAALGGVYDIESELGGGGMSRVFLAEEIALTRKVVIKVLPPDLAAVVSTERFRREILVAATLQHPHIVPLLTAGQADDLLYYVMPYVEGESLRGQLDRDGPLSPDAAARVAYDVVGALAYAHGRGVVHRDIKPDNVLLAGDHALVTDFGVAKALGRPSGGDSGRGMLTTAGVALGTPAYMAPEQASGEPNVDHRADLYGVGVLLYEMLSGRLPFRGNTFQQVLVAQLTKSPEPLEAHRPDTPPALRHIVMRSLEKDPAARWQTAGEMLAALRGVFTPGSTVALATPTPTGRARPRGVRSWAAAALLLLAAAGSLWAWRSLSLRERASPDVIAVLPFTVRGGADLAYLGEGMVNLLSTSFDGAGALRAADPRAILGLVRRGNPAPVDPAAARGVARRLGAGLYVLGDLVQAGDSVRLDATLYGPARGAPARATVQGTTAEIFGLVDELAARLLAVRGGSDRVTRVAAVTTSSLPALKAYLEGDEHFRAGRFAEAAEAFGAATTLDTTFGLAYYRLSVAAEWALLPRVPETAAEQATRHASRLSPADRTLLDALLAYRRGDVVDAERSYRAILARDPSDVEAWLQLGEVLFHPGRIFGRPLAASREPFERVLFFEPAHATALVHLVRIAAYEQDAVEVDSLVERFLRLNPSGERSLEIEALRLALSGDEDDWRDFMAAAAAVSDPQALQAITSLIIWTDKLDTARRILADVIDPRRSAETQAVGHVYTGYTLALQGRLDSARAEMAAAAPGHPAASLAHRAYLSVLPFAPVPRDSLQRVRGELERWNAAAVRPSVARTAQYTTHDDAYPHMRLYLIGLVTERLGDTAATRRAAEQLERLPEPRGDWSFGHALAAGLRARIAARTSPAQALALLEPLTRRGSYLPKLFSPFFSLAAERYLAGSLAASLGRREQASVWFGSLSAFSFFDRVYEAPALLARGRLHERAGFADSAAADYSRALMLWADCDAALRPLADSARTRLATLTGGDY